MTPMGPPGEATQHMMVADLICEDSQTWDRTKIHQLLPAYEEKILEIKLSRKGAKDRLIWLPSKTGIYSAKSGYYEATKEDTKQTLSSCNSGDFNWTTQIWNLKCPPKQKFIMWKAMKNALPVGANLISRGINASGKCPHCDQEETTIHLFFHCEFASQIWSQAPLKTSIEPSRINSLRIGIESLNKQVTLPPSGIGDASFTPWLFWSLWITRNKKVFENKTTTPSEVLTQAITHAREWIYAQQTIPQPSNPSRATRSQNSDTNCPQIFTDAAWRSETKAAGFGWIIKNRKAEPDLPSHDSDNHVRSALAAEAMAMSLALQHAKSLDISEISVASDSQQLIHAIKSETPLTELHGILHDILSICSSFDFIKFSSVPRSANRDADALAKFGLSLSLSSVVPGLTG